MPEETLGYVRLEWTCKQCGTRNPGPSKTCQSCGAPQPSDQEFDLPTQEELVTESAELEQAKAGPDIHCGYCGARNAATAKNCIQCGAPLAEGTARVAGKLLGSQAVGPVPDVMCPACGSANPGSARKCRNCGSSLVKTVPAPPAAAQAVASGKANRGLIPIVAIVLLLCAAGVGLAVFLGQTNSQSGTVQQVRWVTQIDVEEPRLVTHEDWRDQIPYGAQTGSCASRFRRTSQSPVAGAEKVCGTAYVKDEGSGYGKKVQDCEYRVYDDWCEYRVLEWQVARTVTESGDDLEPRWPANLGIVSDQREGRRSQQFEVVFLLDDKTVKYATEDSSLFQQLQPGSMWVLQVNRLGNIVGVERK